MILSTDHLAGQLAARMELDRADRLPYPASLALPWREVLWASRLFFAVPPFHHQGHRMSILLALLLSLGAGSAVAAEAAPVRLETVEEQAVIREVPLTGTITSAQDAALSSKVSGLVSKLWVDAGSEVEAGAELLQLDPVLSELELDRARAATQAARADLDEARRLRDEARHLAQNRNISQTEVEAREARLRAATAEFDRLRAEQRLQAERLERHTLRAPFAGVISRKLTEVGEWVDTGTPVLELVDTHRLRLDVRAPQEYFHRIAPDAEVLIQSDAQPEQRFTGRVRERVPVKDPVSRTFLLRIAITEHDGRLTPGISARALIRIDTGERAPLVSPDALVRSPDGSYRVWTAVQRDGELRAQQQRVQIGPTLSDGVVIRKGLDAGVQVIVRGNESLRDDQPINPADGN